MITPIQSAIVTAVFIASVGIGAVLRKAVPVDNGKDVLKATSLLLGAYLVVGVLIGVVVYMVG